MIFPQGFQTDRLLLRQPTMTDANLIFDLYASDSEVTKYLNWRTHGSVVETQAYLQQTLEKNNDHRGQTYAIEFLNASTGLVGMIAMHHAQKFEIRFGYVLARDFWGRGVVSEVLRPLVTWALRQEQVVRLSAICDAENLGSARVLQKSGFQQEALMRKSDICPNLSSEPRDHFLFSLTR